MLQIHFDFILISTDHYWVPILIFCFEYLMSGVEDIIPKEQFLLELAHNFILGGKPSNSRSLNLVVDKNNISCFLKIQNMIIWVLACKFCLYQESRHSDEKPHKIITGLVICWPFFLAVFESSFWNKLVLKTAKNKGLYISVNRTCWEHEKERVTGMEVSKVWLLSDWCIYPRHFDERWHQAC